MSKIMGVTERTISNWKIKYGVGRVKRDARTLELDNWYNKNKW